MKVSDCPLAGLKRIQLNIYSDNRGFFVERFQAERFAEAGLPHAFTQENHSRSMPGVVRGLHYQYNPAQGKLVGALSGRVWDVAVDIRMDSPTFGRYHAEELSGENGVLLWIPPGFAHGFCTLGDAPADVLYKVTSRYNPAGEGGIRFDDPDIGVAWPVRNSLVSERDRIQPSLQDYKRTEVKWIHE